MGQDSTMDMTVDKRGTESVIVCSGVLDLYNSKGLKDKIVDLTASEERVTVDIRGVTFIDTSVLSDLVVGARAMLRRGKRLKVVAARNSHPLRTLEIVGFSVVMDIEVGPPQTGKESCSQTKTSA